MIAATISPNAAIAISARRKVEERSVLARSTEAISDAADGVDQRIGLGIIDLATAAARAACDQVDGEVADAQQRLLGDGVAAPAEGLQPRQKLDEGERLDQ